MILVSSVFALLFVAFITYSTPCESLKCYEFSGNESYGQRQIDRIVDCAGKCLSYLNENDNGTIIRRCCSDNCKIEDGYKAYSCSKDKCNGVYSDRKLLTMKNKISQKRIILKRTAEEQSSSLSCYDCSAHNPNCGVGEATIVQGCRTCLVYRNIYDNNNVIRRCCTSGCGSPDTVGDYDGRTAYFCSSNLCNGIGAENALTGEAELSSTTTMFPALSSTATTISITTMTTTVQTSFKCYECSGPDCGKESSNLAANCPSCILYRNPNDQTKIERRCCWWNCGPSNSVGTHNGLETYFCTSDKCNGYGAESALSPLVTTTTTTKMSTITSSTVTTTTITQQTSSKCYECSGPDCGKEGSSLAANCPSCILYRNPNDQTKIERRCCWWNCGPSNSVGTHNGLETYFCTGDKCNGYGAESALSPLVTTTTTTKMSTITSSTVTTTTTTQQTSSKCYECSGPDCGKEGSSLAANCPSCILYRNPNDQTKIERRCCWWNCGPSNSVGTHNGLETYFCTGDKCNGYGAESALSPPVTTTTTTKMTTTMTTTTTTATTTTAARTITATTTATTQKTSSQCYECSGPDCGKEGSSLASNCPSCIVYRNPNDQTKIERRCCWWNCGPSNSVGTHNGLETYFCTGDKCNGYGAESALSPPVRTTTTSAMTTTSVTITSKMTTTSSSSSCVLNCQNGGTAETVDGCFCYCLENTNGRECENVDCVQPDIDSETCSSENQPLCEESETFAFECLHLCGKC